MTHRYYRNLNEFILADGTILHNIHQPGTCWGDYCTIHKPSKHKYRDYQLVWANGMLCRDTDDGLIPDPDHPAFQRDQGVIMVNAATCLKCADYIESNYRHDFKYCICQNISVDGGKDYIRHGWHNESYYSDESISFTKEDLGL